MPLWKKWMKKNLKTKMNSNTNFIEYLESDEPEIRHRAQAWQTAINNRAAEGLAVSPYLIELAERHILGKISLQELDEKLGDFYHLVETMISDAPTNYS